MMGPSHSTEPEQKPEPRAASQAETVTHQPVSPGEAATLPPVDSGSETAHRPWPTIPGYEILGELGRGGMGVVYKARQISLKRLVALKMILAGEHASPEHLARFRTEAEAVARVQHPHIVQIHEIAESNGHPFMALEFVEGKPLDKHLAGKPSDPLEAVRLVETLARAVHAAHERGIIHRDLKPANILLTADGQPKITDFGLAKRLQEDAGHTKSGSILGTPSYMAPEQAGAKNKTITPATDVYSLGAILYEMLTGRPPFKGAAPLETAILVLTEEPTPPRQLRSEISSDLEAITLKCLRKESGERYASALALADELRRFLRGEAILTKPAPVWTRVRRWARKHGSLVIATASVAGALLLTVGVYWGVNAFRDDAGSTLTTNGGASPAGAEKRHEERVPHLGLVPPSALAMVTVRLADTWRAPAFETQRRELLGDDAKGIDETIEQLLGFPPGEIERVTWIVNTPNPDRGELPAFLLTTRRPYLRKEVEQYFGRRLPNGSKLAAQKHAGGEYWIPSGEDDPSSALVFVDDSTFWIGSPRTATAVLEQLRDRRDSEFQAPAVQTAARETPLVFVLKGSRTTQQLVRDSVAWEFHRSIEPMLAADSLTVAIGRPTERGRLRTEIRLTYADKVAEHEGPIRALLPRAQRFAALGLQSVGSEVLPDLTPALDALAVAKLQGWFAQYLQRFATTPIEVQVQGSQLVMRSDIPTPPTGPLTDKEKAALEEFRHAVVSQRSAQQLRALAIAMHNYHSDYNQLPKPAIYAKDGKPLLSWRVALLPYLGENGDDIHKKFKLDEPWDSEHNKKLLPLMPKHFSVPGVTAKEPCTTHYQICVGPGAMFEPNQSFSLGQITTMDGTANTIMIAEAAEPVPWTKPEDLQCELDKTLPKFGGVSPDGFNACFGDASIRFIKKEIYNEPRLLHQLIGRNDRRQEDYSRFVK
jgi:serine/threonine protein kinase